MKSLYMAVCAFALAALLAPAARCQQYFFTAAMMTPPNGASYSGSPNTPIQLDVRSLHTFQIINATPGDHCAIRISDWLIGEPTFDGGSNEAYWLLQVRDDGRTDQVQDTRGGTYTFWFRDSTLTYQLHAYSDGSSNPAVPILMLPNPMPDNSTFTLYGEG